MSANITALSLRCSAAEEFISVVFCMTVDKYNVGINLPMLLVLKKYNNKNQ
jgi:hypothetical protein